MNNGLNEVERFIYRLLDNKNLVDFCIIKGIDVYHLDYPRIEYIINNINNFNHRHIIK